MINNIELKIKKNYQNTINNIEIIIRTRLK